MVLIGFFMGKSRFLSLKTLKIWVIMKKMNNEIYGMKLLRHGMI